MYQSHINIKHRNRSHLYWGIDKTNGEVVDIKAVTVRGLNCNCRCAACNGDFIARKGDKNKHHFAHQSNYVCVYANEIAIYLLAKKILEHSRAIQLPSVPVRIGKRLVIAKEICSASIGEVFYQCELEQYPPLLVAMLDNQPTRLLLEFGEYYNTEDIESLSMEAESKDWDCLSIPLPRINDQESINPTMLLESLLGRVSEKSWIRNARADRWKQRLEEAARKPPQILSSSWGTYYECPIHLKHRDGKYYAGSGDCENCDYNLSTYPECKCLAFRGILHLRDFKRSEEQLQEEVSKQRQYNDERNQQIAKRHQQREIRRNVTTINQQHSSSASNLKQDQYSKAERLRIGKQEVANRFVIETDNPVFDQFGTRWLKCIDCGEIKPAEEMSVYGGRAKSAHLGKCRDCAYK